MDRTSSDATAGLNRLTRRRSRRGWSQRRARGMAGDPNWRAILSLTAALVLGVGALYAIRIAAKPLAVLVIAIALAEALEPPVRALSRVGSRVAAIVAVYLGLLLVVSLAAWLVFPVLAGQAGEVISRLPELMARAQSWVNQWDAPVVSQITDLQARALAAAATWLVSFPLRLISWVTAVSVVLFLSAYWLVGAPSISRFVLSLFPVPRREAIAGVLGETGQAMGGYVRGAAINAVIMGVLAWAGLAIIGVDYALVLGVLTMLAEPIPVVGPILVALPVAGVALLDSPTTAVMALGLFAVLQQVEGHLLTPNIMRRQTDMPQTLVLFAILVGGVVGGLLGVLVAIPLAAALRVLTLRLVAPAVRRWTGATLAAGSEPIASGGSDA